MAKLQLKNLRKQFAANVIPVKDINIEVGDGEFLTLLGPSGCGKSTLLRLIAGLETPSQGQVTIGDRDVTNLAPGDRNIAMVFQSYALYPHMTVFENIAASLKLRKIPPDQIQQRVNHVAQKLDLVNLLARKPKQMSGGQRQRVALARSLVRNPEVFLLDEPLSNLDALLREQVRAELKQLFNSQQKPVVYVTHDQTEAMTLSSKVAILSDGYLQQIDRPDEIYTRPANKFVAGFVGSPQMNLLTLKCEENYAIFGDFKIPLPDFSVRKKQITLGIRPEDIRFSSTENLGITIRGKVVLVEYLGKEKLLILQVENSAENIKVIAPYDQTWDDLITLELPTKHIHWFDVDSGDRIQ
ncbi:ABC transporter ATP-binding protein [Okeania sp.]|uniref:ABC transporter ATP-binding protein n=1 Tax=Okeania sp. TaxID=3100323 RepID=UPI002B4B23B1|nr:ABC transporter ATP-binding protein [Okeania sp.]MEB3343267.1 ABC transporter ATP-binding protein [Okeania sp.]